MPSLFYSGPVKEKIRLRGAAKMIRAFGAPINGDDAKIIADYLKKNYGS